MSYDNALCYILDNPYLDEEEKQSAIMSYYAELDPIRLMADSIGVIIVEEIKKKLEEQK